MWVRLLPALSVALGLAACSSRQHEAQEEARQKCEALVQGQSTLRDATQALIVQPLLVETRTDYASLVAGDVCPYLLGRTQISTLVYEYPTNDCPGVFGGGTCAYRCEVRVVGAAPSASAVICARAFVTGQPFLFAAGTPLPP